MLASFVPPEDRLARSEMNLGGVTTLVLTPNHVPEASEAEAPIFLELHGGALIMGRGELAWMMAAGKAAARNGITWAPDYRMAPVHPYPAALDDCLAVYRQGLAQRPASEIIVSGLSAGSNLAAALALRAKDEGLPIARSPRAVEAGGGPH
jgi:acetyl esterase/lipase